MSLEVGKDYFPPVRKLMDKRFNQMVAIIMPGQHYVSRSPVIVYTVLVSCVSVCVRDTDIRVGGMNHFMLPAPKIDHSDQDSWGESGRYGSFAMELLINDILKRGGRRENLEVKVFGGGKIYNGENDVGASNAAWILKYLENDGLSPVKKDLGGIFPRKISYFSDSGKVLMKRIVRLKNDTILKREEAYSANLKKQNLSEGDVTLY